MPSEIGDREEEVADFLRQTFGAGRGLVDLRGNLIDLFAQFVQHALRVVPVESDCRCFTLKLDRPCERRQSGWDPVEEAVGFVRWAAQRPLVFFLSLDPLPEPFGCTGTTGRFVSEYVRMSTYHLGGNCFDDIVEIERLDFLGQPRMVGNLKKEVAEFVAEVVEVVARNRVGDLMGFFDGVWRDRREGLLFVPRATRFLIPECRHDFNKALDVRRRGHSVGLQQFRLKSIATSVSRIRYIMEYFIAISKWPLGNAYPMINARY